MYQLAGKKIFDFIISIIVLVIVFPLMLLALIIVFVADGRPFFYIQKRIGKNGKEFDLYKLRTMVVNADRSGSISFKKDSRIIFGGNWLRVLKIDELPQVLNVVKGEMSIVGPRPTVQEDFDKMSENQKKRSLVLPGLTGLAQISGNTSLSWPERISLDLLYISKQSFLVDIKILIITVLKVVSNKIESNPPEGGEWGDE